MCVKNDLEVNDTPPDQGQDDGLVFQKTELERLGRQRPDVFSTPISEVLFCSSILLTMMMSVSTITETIQNVPSIADECFPCIQEFFFSGCNILLPTVSSQLHIPESAQIWPSSVFPLVTGAFLLPMGRVADRYGGYIVFTSGLAWFFAWLLIAGFSQNYMMLIFCRVSTLFFF